MEALERGLDVDERVGWQHEFDLRASGQELGSDDAAHFESSTLSRGWCSGVASSP